MDLTDLAFCSAFALSLALAAAVSWWLARGFLRRRIRLGARFVLVLLVAALFFQPLARALTGPIDEGSWLCLVCGDQEHQVRYAGLVAERSPADRGTGLRNTSSFVSWYEREIRGEHEHDRIPVGCHRVGIATAALCASDWEIYFAALPRLPDGERAVAMAERVLHTPHGERRALVGALREEGGPFWQVVEGDLVSREDFSAAVAVWLEDHPEWH